MLEAIGALSGLIIIFGLNIWLALKELEDIKLNYCVEQLVKDMYRGHHLLGRDNK